MGPPARAGREGTVSPAISFRWPGRGSVLEPQRRQWSSACPQAALIPDSASADILMWKPSWRALEKEMMKQSILVVDDDPSITSVLRRGLAYEGYEVATASSGKEGLDLVREQPPSLVILDVM